jgi:hypothetical protein
MVTLHVYPPLHSLLLDLGPGTLNRTDPRLTRMNPNRPFLLLPARSLAHFLGSHVLQIDSQPVGIVFRVRQDLGRVQRQDGLGDDGRGFVQEVRIVDSQGLVVPVDFPRDQGLGDEPELEDDPLDLGALLVLLREIGRLVAAATRSSCISTTAPRSSFLKARRPTPDSHGILPQPLRGGRPTAPILRGDPIRPQG